MKNTNLILNPYFLIGLVALLLNDFYFKYEYSLAIAKPKYMPKISPQNKRDIKDFHLS